MLVFACGHQRSHDGLRHWNDNSPPSPPLRSPSPRPSPFLPPRKKLTDSNTHSGSSWFGGKKKTKPTSSNPSNSYPKQQYVNTNTAAGNPTSSYPKQQHVNTNTAAGNPTSSYPKQSATNPHYTGTGSVRFVETRLKITSVLTRVCVKNLQ
jgi:hypothetical protein